MASIARAKTPYKTPAGEAPLYKKKTTDSLVH
jgi:hypothetical protein